MKQLKTILFALFVATALAGTAFAEAAHNANTTASPTTKAQQSNNGKTTFCLGNACT